jgi:aryl-alcohol dehydrogenase-like predicted oxidoreductase
MLIYKAILKYGLSNFSLEILECCEKDNVRAREQYWLGRLEHEYNILETAGSPLGRRHSDETRQKMREAWQADPAKREAALANLAKGRSLGTAASAAARSKAVMVTNIETGETVEYVSQKAAAEVLGVTPAAIRSCLKSKKLLKKIQIISEKSSE